MALYPNLVAEMKRIDVTQRDIAGFLNKTPETICNWMNGRSGDFPVLAAMEVKREFFPDHSVEYLFAETPMAG